ncbi:hypothetical protein DL546_009854 [Coniochaeta pulveracea]|uniref:Uncharacterized protein n=1 Tax=Coniochaeta pulveracea TaxID=177199 RepID=A0A420YN75_9PEZI|nr:hypothetical protein DL546_009854 [Coniochaeta pulveracea]
MIVQIQEPGHFKLHYEVRVLYAVSALFTYQARVGAIGAIRSSDRTGAKMCQSYEACGLRIQTGQPFALLMNRSTNPSLSPGGLAKEFRDQESVRYEFKPETLSSTAFETDIGGSLQDNPSICYTM